LMNGSAHRNVRQRLLLFYHIYGRKPEKSSKIRKFFSGYMTLFPAAAIRFMALPIRGFGDCGISYP